MQSWPNQDPNDSSGQNAWPQQFGYNAQNGQFDPSQQWQQPGVASSQNFFDPSTQHSNILNAADHGGMGSQTRYPDDLNGLSMNQQFNTGMASNMSQDFPQPGAYANQNNLDYMQQTAQFNPAMYQQQMMQQQPQQQQQHLQRLSPQQLQQQPQQQLHTQTQQPQHAQQLQQQPPVQHQQQQHQQQHQQEPNAQFRFTDPYQPQQLSNQPRPMPYQQPTLQQQLGQQTAVPLPAAPSADASSKKRPSKSTEIDVFTAPEPTNEDAQFLSQAEHRLRTGQTRGTPIPGAPYMGFQSTKNMPAPKSYDKLAPLVALPPRSGKPLIPELGRALPCEIQGMFANEFQPSPDKSGLEERKQESKQNLADFESAMKGLGKSRPKYTEYPHAFKEQIKSDEAKNNKAGKKSKKPIRAATRPEDVADAAAWDTIGIVYLEDGAARTSTVVANRVQQAAELFIQLRTDMSKAKTAVDDAIKANKSEAEVSNLKDAAEAKKNALFKALDATVEHADDAVIDNLGGHQKLISSLVNALIACIKTSDFSGKLPKIIFELFTHFRMTRKIAETTNFDTVRKRFEDKGDDEIKDYVREISSKVKKFKSAEPETATGYTGTSASSRAKVSTSKPALEVPSTKRTRDDDSDNRTVKKIAVEASGSSLSKKMAAPLAAKPISSVLPGKLRNAPKPVAKPDVVSSDVPTSKEKEPDTNKPEIPILEAVKAAAAAKGDKLAASASASALSGIASLLDSINAKKPEVVAAPEKEESTPEESEVPGDQAKRERKLARRKLRVTWKSDDELVQVKIFHKHDAEDEGRESNMIRDAADDKSEGMVLKQRATIEDDEDDDDVPYQPWEEPSASDLTLLDDEARKKNFVTRGGEVTFSTEEQKRIADREQRELMAIYADPSDIPPSPRSPLTSEARLAEPKLGQLNGEDPKLAEIQRRWADEQQMGADGAFYAAMGRLDSKNRTATKLDAILNQLKQSTTQGDSNVPLVSGRAIEDIVSGWLRSDKAKTWVDNHPIRVDLARPYHYNGAASQAAGIVLEALVKYLSSKPYPPTSPPDWLLRNEDKTKEWWFGYNKEVASKQRRANAGSAPPAGQNPQEWAAYYAQQAEMAPYMSIIQQMGGAPAPTLDQQSQMNDSQLQSILSVINQGPQGGAPPPPPPPPPANNFGNINDPMQLLGQMAQSQVNAQSSNRDRDRDRDWDDRTQERDFDREAQRHRDRDGDWGQDRFDRQNRDDYKKKKPTLPPHKPVNKALIGTKPCTFWQQGKCARGDQCTFRHD